jgi:hypothetical protein
MASQLLASVEQWAGVADPASEQHKPIWMTSVQVQHLGIICVGRASVVALKS